MVISIKELYNDVFSVVNPIQNGFFDDQFTFYTNQSSRSLFDSLTGLIEEYQYGKPEARTGGFQKTSKITDSLIPFIKKVVLRVDQYGLGIIPSDYALFASMRLRYDGGALFQTMCNGNANDCPEFPSDPTAPTLAQKIKIELGRVYQEVEVEPTDLNQISVIKQSSIYFPDKEFPICYPLTVDGAKPENNISYFQIEPANVGSVIFMYLRLPKDAVYATMIDPDTNDNVFDAANSINLEWNKKDQNKLVQRISNLYGGFISNQNIQQSATQQLQTGT